ncbi:hypothetical protein EVAR_50337_1 [Eumeta japonica]|uniref:Uncharacterized protein n=1 Tax=Eumeta variegata TaxID=151549 RepID=A0A4C1XM35_EUMVA|nr:hypothetical protein EVAR_50337_1 [Eumeta japonica]
MCSTNDATILIRKHLIKNAELTCEMCNTTVGTCITFKHSLITHRTQLEQNPRRRARQSRSSGFSTPHVAPLTLIPIMGYIKQTLQEKNKWLLEISFRESHTRGCLVKTFAHAQCDWRLPAIVATNAMIAFINDDTWEVRASHTARIRSAGRARASTVMVQSDRSPQNRPAGLLR